MPYTNPDTMAEIQNIIDDFDPETQRSLFKDQIINNTSYLQIPVNYFSPLYTAFEKARELENVDPDHIDTITREYYGTCRSILDYICSKFTADPTEPLALDDDWMETHVGQLPAVAMAFYQFFVLDIFYVILEVMNNYIYKNLDSLFDVFGSSIQSKNVSAATNMKKMSPKYAAIATAIYDVTDYAFQMLDVDSFFTYVDQNYVPGKVICRLVSDSILTGDFIRKFADIHKEDIDFRSRIGCELQLRIIKMGHLTQTSITTPDGGIEKAKQLAVAEGEPEPATESFATIDSDVDSE